MSDTKRRRKREPALPSEQDTIHDRIQIARQMSGLNTSEAAYGLGIPKSTYLKWEEKVSDEIHRPPFHMIAKMADYYGVTTDYLLGRTLWENDCTNKGTEEPIGSALNAFSATKMQVLSSSFDGYSVIPDLLIAHSNFAPLLNSLYALWCKSNNVIYKREMGMPFIDVDENKPYSVEKMIGKNLSLSDEQIMEFLLDNSCRLAREIFRDMARVDEAEKEANKYDKKE